MSIIKEIIAFFKESGEINKEYTVEEVYNTCYSEINTIEQDLSNFSPKSAEEDAGFFLQVETKLKSQQTILFHKCCDIKGIKESQAAFCTYRRFLEKYNAVILLYNKLIRDNCSGKIVDLTNQILKIKTKLLPVNNDNIEMHSKHYLANESYYREIEKAENERRKLLNLIIQKEQGEF